MLETVFLALWFFAPAGVANVTPILAARIPWLSRYDQPIDAGCTWRGRRLLGDHKTWRGLLTGVIMAVMTILLQAYLVRHSAQLAGLTAPVGYAGGGLVWLGLLLGLGALGGDAIESFFKRQLDVKPGHGWFPFDQIDYIIGGALASLLILRLDLLVYVWVTLLWLGIHLFASYLGWRWRLKDRPI